MGITGKPCVVPTGGGRVSVAVAVGDEGALTGRPSKTSMRWSPAHVRDASPAQGCTHVVAASVGFSLRMESPHQHSLPRSTPAKTKPAAQHVAPHRSGVMALSPPGTLVRFAMVDGDPSSR